MEQNLTTFLDGIIEKEDKNHFEILSMIYGADHVNNVITNRGIHLNQPCVLLCIIGK